MQVDLTGKIVKELSSQTAQVVEAVSRQGEGLFAKIINLAKAQEKGYDECLRFNTEVLEDVEEFPFKDNFLAVRAQIETEEFLGLVTNKYDCNLAQFILREALTQKDCLAIFDQVVRAIYSLTMNGYWHRNIRAEHFVRCGKLWCLESLVFSEEYSKAEGFSSQYLWSSKHEPPEFEAGGKYQDEDFNQMAVWNLGCILLQLLVGSHRLSNREVINKFKGKAFSFEAIGIKSDRIAKFSNTTKELLAGLLHHNPTKRTKLADLFKDKNASEAVAKHAAENKQAIPPSKISVGRSVRGSKINAESRVVLKDIAQSLAQRQKEKQQILGSSRINSVVDQDDFLDNLQEISNRIPSGGHGLKGGRQQQGSIEQLMSLRNSPVRKALQLYKSYYDQSELLVLAIENVDKLEFSAFRDESDVKEVRLLVKYAVVFVSLLNLNSLAEGFNQSRNILDLDTDQFTLFQNSKEYSAFQKFVNFKRSQRNKQLDALRQEITFFKKKNLATKDEKVFDLLQRDYRKTNFQDIKLAYRMILKFAYDSISEQYNKQKRSQVGLELAQRAMFITYCLTIDKLYIKQHIPDNFKYYFEWISKPASNYVPMNDFKDYILRAPKEVLIQNSRYILKKYYNI